MNTLTLPNGLAAGFLPDDAGHGCRLLAGRCRCNGRHFFPMRAYCPECLEPLELVPLIGRGKIYATTTVRTRAPFGLPEPYAVGYVDLTDVKLRVFGLFSSDSLDELQPDREVELNLAPMGVDGTGKPCLRPVFRLAGGCANE